MLFLDNSKISPREVSANLDESVRFECLTDEPEEDISWYFKGFDCFVLIDEDMEMVPNLRQSGKYLNVDYVTENNQGFYECRFYTDIKHPLTEIFIEFRTRATLTVKGMLKIKFSVLTITSQ